MEEQPMRFMLTAATAAALIAGSALAQAASTTTGQSTAPGATTQGNYGAGGNTTGPANTGNATTTTQRGNTGATTNNAPSNPAVKTTEGNNPGAPAPGANSFTEGQAKARIESRGFAGVTGLSKDTNGLWRGKAMKDGKAVNVTLDYQGNVTAN